MVKQQAHHNVGTCLWHVSPQTAMYQRIGNIPKAYPYTMALLCLGDLTQLPSKKSFY